jgi:2,3-dihydroxy-p-cumate/2,3-dihydroxybenzoate 3,4-dioxygenase
VIRYRRLGSVALNVTDLQRSLAFYEEIVGLTAVGQNPDGSITLGCGVDGCMVVLHESPVPGFRSVGLALESDSALETLRLQLSEHGVAHEEVAADDCLNRNLVRAWRVAEPNMKAAFEFYLERETAPALPFVPTVAKIQRIGHVVFSTPRYAETVAFMQSVLAFVPSDDIDGIITFMRPYPSPFHHGIGVGRGPHHGLHHVNLMVSEIDDIGRAIHRFERHQVPIVFGPGRHIASNSVFLYFLDPDGLTLEYSFGMEEFTELEPRVARTLPPLPESLDSWGGKRDSRMSAVGSVQPYRVGAGWLAEAEV